MTIAWFKAAEEIQEILSDLSFLVIKCAPYSNSNHILHSTFYWYIVSIVSMSSAAIGLNTENIANTKLGLLSDYRMETLTAPQGI